MTRGNFYLYVYVAEIIKLPLIQDILGDAGAIITDTGLIWPIDAKNGQTHYYNIDVIKQKIYHLPSLGLDFESATEVQDQELILAIILSIQTYIRIVGILIRLSQFPDPLLVAAFAQNPNHMRLYTGFSNS